MGLEAATYPSQLTVTNPIATDKKNQGDDHLRLIKTVLQNGIPNWDRPFRLPEISSKSADYPAVEADENKIFLYDTSGAARTLTLPTPTFDGWMCRVVKTTTDTNPVYIAPPSGTINGLAKMRLNVPYIEYVFLWTGSTFIRLKAPGELAPGTLEDNMNASIPVGYARATGQTLVRADHPELFAAWGTTYGAPSGTDFSAPDTRDRVTVGIGTTYVVTNTGGANTRVIAQANIPSFNLDYSSLGIGMGTFFGNITCRNFQIPGGAGANQNVTDLSGTPGDNTAEAVNFGGSLALTGTLHSGGSSTAFDIRQPYIASNKIFRLC